MTSMANGIKHKTGLNDVGDLVHPTTPDDGVPSLAIEHLEPIAIIGMAMRLLGGVKNAEDFWDLLIEKRDGQCRVPANRYNVDTYLGRGKPGHVSTDKGYFLEVAHIDGMDLSFWTVFKREAALMDPQQRLLLEVVHECFENSGTVSGAGTNIGCYVGVYGED